MLNKWVTREEFGRQVKKPYCWVTCKDGFIVMSQYAADSKSQYKHGFF
jgi:hypothetical protein